VRLQLSHQQLVWCQGAIPNGRQPEMLFSSAPAMRYSPDSFVRGRVSDACKDW
jgi:hypothetical protein